MRYKTKRNTYKILVVILLFDAMCAVGIALMEANEIVIVSIVVALVVIILAFIFLVYSCTANLKRNRFVKYGERFSGKIVAAEVLKNSREEDTYFLYIEFFDRGKKTRFTEGYVGDPCTKLRNLNCDIYKLDSKYIEANFSVRGKKESKINLHIPTKRYKLFSSHKGYV
ncbi:MAG: hypothetical protein K6F84_04330 [Lachnospiraceae bacterium]|nr:hypothetical protein [Lachnospiraceae bacterium]